MSESTYLDTSTLRASVIVKFNEGKCSLKKTEMLQEDLQWIIPDNHNSVMESFCYVNLKCSSGKKDFGAFGKPTTAKEMFITVDLKLETNQKEMTDTCDLSCARKRTEKQLRKTIRILRKAISREQFHVCVSGMDHEMSRMSPGLSDPQESCSMGQMRVDNRCGGQHLQRQRVRLPEGKMFCSDILTEPSRKEVEMREAASLRQQRRMKQAVQFIHKDSADLLPLDGLKKLGTSKDTQPHNILQRRLLETNLSKLQNNRGTWTPKNDILAQTNKLNQTNPDNPKQKEEEDLIFVCCQCAGKDLKALIDTSCQYNLLSSACLDRLGLKGHVKTYKTEGEKMSLPCNMKVIGQIEHLAVTLGTIHVDCSAVVTEDNEKHFSLGLQTLKSLKCVINMEKHHLVLGKTEREEIPFVDNNISKNGDNFSED